MPPCGRTSCTLSGRDIERLLRARGMPVRAGRRLAAFQPAPSLPPTATQPVLVRAADPPAAADEHQDDDEHQHEPRSTEGTEGTEGSGLELTAMQFGLRSTGPEGRGGGALLLNARAEQLDRREQWSAAVVQGRRCVVVCDAFFERQRATDTSYRLAPPPDAASPLLLLAGLHFPQHEARSDGNGASESDGEGVSSSVVIVTTEPGAFGAVHHRMPLVLPDAAAVRCWLDTPVHGVAAPLARVLPVLTRRLAAGDLCAQPEPPRAAAAPPPRKRVCRTRPIDSFFT